MPASLRITLVLCSLKLRLLLNSLRNWASIGKSIGVAISVIIGALLITSGASDLLNAMRLLPYAELMLDWLLGGIIVYVIFIVFTGDLITGHSINTGQMSSDFNYLRTLPIPPLCLIFIKLFERVITDYLGILILLSAFLGISCRDGTGVESVLLALALFLQISFLIGMAINLCMIFLSRFFKMTTINNFFSLLGYVSAFLTIGPYLILSNFPIEAMDTIINNLDILNETVFRFFLPIKWLAISLISKGFCDEFFFFTAFWAICMAIGTAIFYVTINLNWLSFSHSNSNSRQPVTNRSRLFRGLFYKETLLITSDFNLLINALMMPISLIILEIYFLKGSFNLTTADSILNIIYGSIIYFSMFGPINCIGSEGKAISLLETLPISAGTLLRRKYIFWLTIAETVFVPAAAITLWQMNFTGSVILTAALSAALFTAACVWVAVSVSAVFPCFDSKILQQRSTLLGKLTALCLMLLIVPVKSFSWLNFYSLTIFLCMGALAFYKAKIALVFRLDREAQDSESHKQLDIMLFFLAFAGIEASFSQFFNAVIPGQDTGMWNWLVPAAVCLPAGILLLLTHRPSPLSRKAHAVMPAGAKDISKINNGNIKYQEWLHCAVLTGLTIVASEFTHRLRPAVAELFHDDVAQIVRLSESLAMPVNIWQILLLLATMALAAIMANLVSRRFFGDSAGYSNKTIGVALLTLVAPGALLPVALLTALAMLSLQKDSADYRMATILATSVAAVQAGYFIFY